MGGCERENRALVGNHLDGKEEEENTVKKTRLQTHITETPLVFLATLGKKTKNSVQGKKE